MDCFRCSFNHIESQNAHTMAACDNLNFKNSNHTHEVVNTADEGSTHINCSVPHFGFIDNPKYGAQLAWWLQFFPPEQFLIVSAWQLRDPEESVKV